MPRSITVWQGTALYVGAVIGSGILILPGMTAGIAGADALLSWGGMILFSIPIAFTFAFLARDYPSAGGVSTFVERAFGRYAGALIGWFYFLGATAGQFIVPLTGGIYFAYALHRSQTVAFVIAASLLLGATISNYFGLRTSGTLQLATSGLIVAVLLTTIVCAVPFIHRENLEIGVAVARLPSVAKAAILIFWSFFGWEAIASLAPEFQRPERNIVWATLGAIVLVGTLYMAVALAVVGTHAYSNQLETLADAVNDASLAEVMRITVGNYGTVATAALSLVVCFGTTNAFVASISRLGYSLAHKQLAPAWLDHTDERTATPRRAVLLVGALAGLGLLLTYLFHISMRQLVYIPNSLGIATYVLGTAAGVRLIRSWIGKACAGVACGICTCAYPFVGTAIWLPLTVGIACIAYVAWRMRRETRIPAVGPD